ncbi:MAG: ATP-binding cassette domain-containing protein [Chitinophagaceae bacterium]|nr:MAG: ATP-binding cassette domain-containing protein [Chitinophagaceae bacterium]
MLFETFEIHGLFDIRNIEFRLIDNRLILIAGNGAGKTTILRIMFLFLSKQWGLLSKEHFKAVKVTFSTGTFEFNRADYLNAVEHQNVNQTLEEFPLYREGLSKMFESRKLEDLLRNPSRASIYADQFDVPVSLLLKVVDRFSNTRVDSLNFDLGCRILYLPTYRRIERSFDDLFEDLDKRLEEFLSKQQMLSRFLNGKDDYGVDEEFGNVFTRIWNERDLERWKKHEVQSYVEKVEFGMRDVVFKVADFMSTKDENESYNTKLELFIKTCNSYLDDKILILRDENKLGSIDAAGNEIDIDLLSSGEKQMVSIFAHTVFSNLPTFIIFDEPELSLAIRWQERIINDLTSLGADGFIIATHSPFIISDELRAATQALN